MKMINDRLGPEPNPSADDLQAVFGLTASEAKLATYIVRGKSPKGASREIGIAYETARHQLKTIFQKTYTNRQSQLAVLLARVKT